MEIYHTIYKGGNGEIVEKKSRFIATVRPVQTEAVRRRSPDPSAWA